MVKLRTGMVASTKKLRILIPLIATVEWCIGNTVWWPTSCESSCTTVVMALVGVPNQPASAARRRHQHLNLQTSHPDMSIRHSSDDSARYPDLFPEMVSDRNKISGFGGCLLVALLLSMNAATAFAGDLTPTGSEESSVKNSILPTGTSIVSCRTSNGSTSNCVSTASVKQVDLFMLPWTWPESISGDEVIGRLKGVIASDQTLSTVDATKIANDDYFFRVRAARNVCRDEIEILVNPRDRVMTFRSQQVDGPDNVSDFGANRRRLDDIRKQLKVVTVLGGGGDYSDDSNHGESREGLTGQLKAFWGFQSGGGFESILLDEDE